MIISFTVKNYRSFKHERTFSMEATGIKEHKDSVKTVYKRRVLPVAVIYGANSGGKSNLIKAVLRMRSMLLKSVHLNENDPLPYDPFKLDNCSNDNPTLFEMLFATDEAFYRYGFEYDKEEIVNEWLFEQKFGEREYNLFLRAGEAVDVSSARYKEGVGKDDSLNKNRLFLSLVAQLKGEKSQQLMDWFRGCNVLSGLKETGYAGVTLEMFHDHQDGADEANRLFQKLQLGFNRYVVKDAELAPEALETMSESFRKKLEEELKDGQLIETLTAHNIYDENGMVIGERSFSSDMMESEGTKKIIELSGPLFDTLMTGKTLVIDELDAKLHPLLTRNIVLLFMNPETNKNNAQLIFATHDTNLLDLRVLRRDQIWFAEKDKADSTDIYSLVEFKDENGDKIRNDRNIERDYISGRYGAIPFIGG